MITPAHLKSARGGGRRPMVDRSSDRIVTLVRIALAVRSWSQLLWQLLSPSPRDGEPGSRYTWPSPAGRGRP